MSKFIYEQTFDVKLYSELHVTDEYKETHSCDGTIGEFCGEPTIDSMESALSDLLVTCYLDPKEVACMRAICDDSYAYDTFNHKKVLDINFTLVDEVAHTNIERTEHGYKVISDFSVQTTSPTMLNESDILARLPQVIRLFGNVSVIMHDDYSKVDIDEVLKDTKAYCNLNYCTYGGIHYGKCIEIPDKLNVTILGCYGDDVFKVLTYHRDLYDTCAKYLDKHEHENYDYFNADSLVFDVFNYGLSRYDYDSECDECFSIVNKRDNYSAAEFFNEYLNTYINLKCDDDLAERVCDFDGEIKDNVVWTEELVDEVMKGFGFTKD